jgi:hypothetical protein
VPHIALFTNVPTEDENGWMALGLKLVNLGELRDRGADLEFVSWLEGESDRLPRFEAARKLKDAEFAGAIRAVVWLTTCLDHLKITPAEWQPRYELLERFLWEVLKSTYGFPASRRDEDLAHLERVLEVLLPASSWKRYRDDMLHVRRLDPLPKPPSGETRRKSTGGKKQSEQTQRMRAAITYLSDFTKAPYPALAQIWNNKTSPEKYDPITVQSRIRKGPYFPNDKAADRSVLHLWRSVYDLDLRFLFTGPFPLAPEIEELARRK